jgi:hypothetical protein
MRSYAEIEAEMLSLSRIFSAAGADGKAARADQDA